MRTLILATALFLAACDPQISTVYETPPALADSAQTMSDMASVNTACETTCSGICCHNATDEFQKVCVNNQVPNRCGGDCDSGWKTCTPNQPDCCGSVCTNLRNDGENCGACGVKCAANGYCSNGTCVE